MTTLDSHQPAQVGGVGQKRFPQEDKTDRGEIYVFEQISNIGREFDIELVIENKENQAKKKFRSLTPRKIKYRAGASNRSTRLNCK